jgi:hypothetical protein
VRYDALTRYFVVGLPGFEPGTSASRTEPDQIAAFQVIAHISVKFLVKANCLSYDGDRCVPLNTAVFHGSAPFPRQFSPAPGLLDSRCYALDRFSPSPLGTSPDYPSNCSSRVPVLAGSACCNTALRGRIRRGASAARCETRLLAPRVFDGAEREHVVGQWLQVAMSEYGDRGGV